MDSNNGVMNTSYATTLEKPRVLFFDIETNGLQPDVIHCLVTMDEDGDIRRYNHAEEGNLRDGLETLKEADLLIGHNIIGYDLQVIHSLYPAWTTKACVRDTMVCSRLAWPHLRDLDFKRRDFPREMIGSHSLKAWGVRLGFQKFGYGEQEDAWVRWSKEMEDYCVRDVEITHRLFRDFIDQKVPPGAVELEHEIHDICEVMTWRGFYFNREQAEKLYARLLAEKDQIEAKLQELFPPKEIQLKTKVKLQPFNPGSRLQIANRFNAGIIAHHQQPHFIMQRHHRPRTGDRRNALLRFPVIVRLHDGKLHPSFLHQADIAADTLGSQRHAMHAMALKGTAHHLANLGCNLEIHATRAAAVNRRVIGSFGLAITGNHIGVAQRRQTFRVGCPATILRQRNGIGFVNQAINQVRVGFCRVDDRIVICVDIDIRQDVNRRHIGTCILGIGAALLRIRTRRPRQQQNCQHTGRNHSHAELKTQNRPLIVCDESIPASQCPIS